MDFFAPLWFPIGSSSGSGSGSGSSTETAILPTVRDLITDALREIRVVGADGQIDDGVLEYGLRILIGMVDSMQADRLQLYTVGRATYALTANQQSRTIGISGQNFTAPRPLWVTSAKIIPVGETLEIPLHVYTRQEWFAIALRSMTDQYPRGVLYEPSTADYGTFSFWPIPTTAATFAFATPTPLDSPITLNTVLSYPPGYAELWRYALAKRLGRPMGVAIVPDLLRDYTEALGLVRRLNDDGPPPAKVDLGLLNISGFDIRSNGPRLG